MGANGTKEDPSAWKAGTGWKNVEDKEITKLKRKNSVKKMTHRWKAGPAVLETDKGVTDPDIFISFSKEDLSMIQNLKSQLELSGLKCWMDDLRFETGLLSTPEINTAINSSKVILLCVSPAAASSPHFPALVKFTCGLKKPVWAAFLTPPDQLKSIMDLKTLTTLKGLPVSVPLYTSQAECEGYLTRLIGDVRNGDPSQVSLAGVDFDGDSSAARPSVVANDEVAYIDAPTSTSNPPAQMANQKPPAVDPLKDDTHDDDPPLKDPSKDPDTKVRNWLASTPEIGADLKDIGMDTAYSEDHLSTVSTEQSSSLADESAQPNHRTGSDDIVVVDHNINQSKNAVVVAVATQGSSSSSTINPIAMKIGESSEPASRHLPRATDIVVPQLTSGAAGLINDQSPTNENGPHIGTAMLSPRSPSGQQQKPVTSPSPSPSAGFLNSSVAAANSTNIHDRNRTVATTHIGILKSPTASGASSKPVSSPTAPMTSPPKGILKHKDVPPLEPISLTPTANNVATSLLKSEGIPSTPVKTEDELPQKGAVAAARLRFMQMQSGK
mmetsp:Transcript_33185/g.53816  ORF Transcript_33185/g.53816 Transcript_33185/m.53816 type:complete len:554 (-) Transcript_33185:123-1784(-)|eukprot:CAMPEP_0184666662 /NCGR_PEP_ID=MMETSP0308-20130426/63011_1 /TAXON_ID=38269 /ORGANISM="Gloeochaete witrockiana, Strain SAG 46.84" /LENGTH=553 /DNA_ID=CAMNT_0027111369 /DNA_START=211 /DNA_END=1872 /DNA_ORIENTATION=-